PAVIFDIHPDAVALEAGRDPDRALRRLSRRLPIGGPLQPVVDGVPDGWQDGVAKTIQDRAIDSDIATVDDEPDVLPVVRGEVAHGALQPVERLRYGPHPELTDLLDEVVRRPGQASSVRGGFAYDAPDTISGLPQMLVQGILAVGPKKRAVRS